MRRKALCSVVATALTLVACGIDVVGQAADADVLDDAGRPLGDSGGAAADSSTGDATTSDAADPADAAPPRDADASDPIDAADASPCALCPASASRVQCISHACVATRRVFVTSGKWNGNLGGVNGADQKCFDAAQAAGLGGTWSAWLSDANTSPFLRFQRSAVPYRLLDGTILANDWNDLVDQNLARKIDLDEKGTTITAAVGVEVWTGTKANGDRFDPTCNNFTANQGSQNGQVGVADQTGAAWSAVYEQMCNFALRLYCFEQ